MTSTNSNNSKPKNIYTYTLVSKTAKIQGEKKEKKRK